jgi:hypothetical protein
MNKLDIGALSEEQEKQIGTAIARLLKLPKIRSGHDKGRYNTIIGTKTELGLARTILNKMLDIQMGDRDDWR